MQVKNYRWWLKYTIGLDPKDAAAPLRDGREEREADGTSFAPGSRPCGPIDRWVHWKLFVVRERRREVGIGHLGMKRVDIWQEAPWGGCENEATRKGSGSCMFQS